MGTLTHDPHGFTRQNAPKNVENGGEMAEIHQISMIFTKLAISQSVLHQKICSWTCFVGGVYVNPYLYLDLLVPIPTTRMGMPYPCICLVRLVNWKIIETGPDPNQSGLQKNLTKPNRNHSPVSS